MAVLSVASAVPVSADYYPHHHHHAHPAHIKYIEPTHEKPVKYIHQSPVAVAPISPVAPVYKQFAAAAPVNYIHPEPHPVKYLQNPHYAKHVDYDEPAQYEFGYDVQDHQTGDFKSHTEKRNGDAVHGRYEVLDPDGWAVCFEFNLSHFYFMHNFDFSFKRIVEYTADDHNGFNAVVRREPTDVKIIKKVYEPEVVKHIAPIAAPVKYFTPQPEAIVQPVQKYFTPAVHQKVVAPIVKQYVAPKFYAAPEFPKYFKPVEKVTKIMKPAYAYEPHSPYHTAVNYVQPTPHYAHY